MAAIEEDRRQYDQTRADYKPFLDAGYDALDLQGKFLAGDWSGFMNAPDYKFAVDQGLKALDRSAAAGGRLFSGGADADRIALGQGLATQYANNYWNKLAGRANQGQVAVGDLGGLGASMAARIGGQYGAIGNARATSYTQQAQNNAGFLLGLAGAVNRTGQQQGWWGVKS